MNVVFTGGGTGGHVYPAIAIADALRARGDSVSFIGSADRLEATLVPRAGYALATVSSRPLVRKLSPELPLTAWSNAAGTLQSLRALRKAKPDFVIATGGYVCFPVVVAARMLRAARLFRGSIALLEPNAHPGLTNRLLAPLVDEVWGAFASGDRRFAGKYVRTGIPVRAALRALPPRAAAIAKLGLSERRKTLLAMGGSQGARSINDALATMVKSGGLPEGWQLIHVTGEREYDRVVDAIGAGRAAVRPYLDDLSDAYAAADLVLARAGASTLGELAAAGKPAILVPYPFASDDHQARNAEGFARSGAAVVLSDGDLQGGRLPALLARVAEPAALAALQSAADELRGGDPVATILARVDWLAKRKNVR